MDGGGLGAECAKQLVKWWEGVGRGEVWGLWVSGVFLLSRNTVESVEFVLAEVRMVKEVEQKGATCMGGRSDRVQSP